MTLRVTHWNLCRQLQEQNKNFLNSVNIHGRHLPVIRFFPIRWSNSLKQYYRSSSERERVFISHKHKYNVVVQY